MSRISCDCHMTADIMDNDGSDPTCKRCKGTGEIKVAKPKRTYTLTYDHIADHALKPSRETETVLFRLLDDDGDVYYSGFATDEHAVLTALDRKADSDGCTTAEIMTSGRYVALN